MEIEQKIYEQYRDTPYKKEGPSKDQENANQVQQNNQNLQKIDAYKEFLKRINESVNEPHGRRISDSITLSRNIVNINQSNIQNNHLNSNNKIINQNNDDIQIKLKEPHKFTLDPYEKRKNITYINNLYNQEIEYENNNPNYNDNQNIDNKNENKVLYDRNNFGGFNSAENNNNNEIENLDYNPFRNNNEEGNLQNHQNIDLNNQNNINSEQNEIHIPNIYLTSITEDEDETNKEENGIFSRFLNIFKKSKGDKGEEEKKNLNNKFETIEQKLRNEPNDKKDDNNYNISLIPEDKEKKNINDISKLKKDLDGEEGLIDYGLENPNQIENNIPNNQPFIESQNIYHNNNNNNNDGKNESFYVNAEPIENKYQINNNTDEEIIDLDKNSEYSIRTGTNIGQIVRKNSKYCPVLIAVLLGAAGLLFLIYKSKKLREIMLGLLKAIPNFFKELFGMLGQGIDDFLEKYNDNYRFLGGLIFIFFIWIILRYLFKRIDGAFIKKK